MTLIMHLKNEYVLLWTKSLCQTTHNRPDNVIEGTLNACIWKDNWIFPTFCSCCQCRLFNANISMALQCKQSDIQKIIMWDFGQEIVVIPFEVNLEIHFRSISYLQVKGQIFFAHILILLLKNGSKLNCKYHCNVIDITFYKCLLGALVKSVC